MSPDDVVHGRRTDQFAFAVGTSDTKRSSTWLLRIGAKIIRQAAKVTTSPEFFVINLDAGSDVGHLSFHAGDVRGRDPVVHFRHVTPDGRSKHTPTSWPWPAPMPGTNSRLLRLATIIVPHSALGDPPGRPTSLPIKLLAPPPANHQLNIDMFAEIEPVDLSVWPGMNSGTSLVAQFILSTPTAGPDEPPQMLLRWVFVSSVRAEGRVMSGLPKTNITVAGAPADLVDRIAAPGVARAVVFGRELVDGQRIPFLAELPVGSLTVK